MTVSHFVRKMETDGQLIKQADVDDVGSVICGTQNSTSNEFCTKCGKKI